MTDVSIPNPAVETALASALFADGETALMPYLGAKTPERLDAPEVESEALLAGAAVHDLGWLRRIEVRGEDRFRWLSGMVTNMVETLPDRTGAYNLVLNAQGRIQGDLYTWRRGDAIEIETTAEQVDALMAHFDKFIIMDDVELVPGAGQSALGLTGPSAGEVLGKLGLGSLADPLTCSDGEIQLDGARVAVRICGGYGTVVPHFALWVEDSYLASLLSALTAAGAKPVGAIALESLRVAEGIPAYGVDIQSRDLAQETAQERALSFTKGCYLGQEIVERIRSRGQVHRHLRSVELVPEADGSEKLPLAGTELKIAGSADDAKTAATLTSVASLAVGGQERIFGIAMVRAEAEVGGRMLEYPGGVAHILKFPMKVAGHRLAEERA